MLHGTCFFDLRDFMQANVYCKKGAQEAIARSPRVTPTLFWEAFREWLRDVIWSALGANLRSIKDFSANSKYYAQ